MELIVALIHHVPVPISLLCKRTKEAMSRAGQAHSLACLPASQQDHSPALTEREKETGLPYPSPANSPKATEPTWSMFWSKQVIDSSHSPPQLPLGHLWE